MSDTVLTYLPTIAIKINGAANSDIEADLEEVVIDLSFNLPAMATLRVHDPDLAWVDAADLDIGKPLTVTLGAPGSFGGETGLVFDGEIVALEPEFSADGQHMFTVRAYDKSHRLHLGRKSRTFLQQKDSDLASKIAGESGLSTAIDATTTVHDYILQCNQTDMEFLSERARRIGYQLYVQDGKLHFHATSNKVAGPVMILGDDLRQFHVRASAARQVKAHQTIGWDEKKKLQIEGKADAATLWHTIGISTNGGAKAESAFQKGTNTILDQHVVDKSEADKLAAAAAADFEGNFITADGVAFGDPKIKPAVEIELKGLGTRFSGKYIVSSATHIFRKDGYDVHFTVTGRHPQTVNNLLHTSQPQNAAAGRVNGVVVGIVTNVDDAEGKMARVKVKYPWLQKDPTGKDIESNWARIATPMAGPGRGMLFVPEVNDEVLIAFEQGDVNRPYMVGALWNGKDAPPEQSTAYQKGGKIVHRVIKTRIGHLIILDDSDDKPSIQIIDKTGANSIVIDSAQNTITVKANKDLIVDVKGNIDMKAGGNITMTANMNVSAEAKGGNVDLKAGVNGSFQANANLDLKANANATLEGTAMATVKSNAMTQVQSSALTKVAGNPIMLN